MQDHPSGARSVVPFRRSRQNRVIGGVCGGLAEYLAVDPTLVRLGFVLFAVMGGSGVLVYILAWLIVPEQKEGEVLRAAHIDSWVPLAFGMGLVGMGGLLLVDRLIDYDLGRYVWPLGLIVAGAMVLLRVGR